MLSLVTRRGLIKKGAGLDSMSVSIVGDAGKNTSTFVSFGLQISVLLTAEDMQTSYSYTDIPKDAFLNMSSVTVCAANQTNQTTFFIFFIRVHKKRLFKSSFDATMVISKSC